MVKREEIISTLKNLPIAAGMEWNYPESFGRYGKTNPETVEFVWGDLTLATNEELLEMYFILYTKLADGCREIIHDLAEERMINYKIMAATHEPDALDKIKDILCGGKFEYGIY